MVFGARIDEGPRAALLADEVLPERPLRQWVLSLPMALRFLLATRPAVLSEELGVVYRTISGHLLARAGVRRAAGHTGAVTLIQRFGSALNLNVHFHMLFVDGVYVTDGRGAPVFRAVRSPGAGELQALVQQMAERIGRLLEKRGLIERDAQSAWLSGEPVQAGLRTGSLDELIGHCITWRIAAGPRAGGAEGVHAADGGRAGLGGRAQPERALHAARALSGQSAV
ncbi:MAG: transposase [bacterium]|nr:transposase [Betaproteobacteria bacterium]